jgi:gamma-glutamyltranspeptidase/glutathione hydrolase
VAVPGSVSGLEMARWRSTAHAARALIAPAIALAEEGFVLEQGDVDMLRYATERLPQGRTIRRDLFEPGRAVRRRPEAGAKDLGEHAAPHQRRRARRFLQGAGGRGDRGVQPAGKGIITQADLDQYRRAN